jgi:hypothetical protein
MIQKPHAAAEPIILELDPVGELPEGAIALMGQILAWSTYIEFDLFQLYAIAKQGDLVARRREFYKNTHGMRRRIDLVRKAYAGRLKNDVAKAFESIMKEAEAMALLRNDWAHNPFFMYGADPKLMMLKVSSGDFAGNLAPIDVEQMMPLLPLLGDFHRRLTMLIGLLGNPTGGDIIFAFGPMDEQISKQLQALIDERASAPSPSQHLQAEKPKKR